MSKGRVLFLATVPSMIVAFNTGNIMMLQKMGYIVHVACNFKDRSACTDKQMSDMVNKLSQINVVLHQIDIPRKPWHILKLAKAYSQVNKLAEENTFSMMHNQSCVSGIIGRIALHRKIPTVIHTEHGFYYFKGGALINWIFYPFDRLCSRWTDALITINKDDYSFAKKHMRAQKTVYIPGVGIDTEFYKNTVIDKKAMRASMGISENAFVISSVGELNDNKNHAVIIKAIARLGYRDIYYVVNGEGEDKDRLLTLAEQLNINDRIILTGNVNNVNEYLKMADVFAFPSKREGLGLAALEAMACGLPLITSNKNGINDYATDGKTGFMCEPNDIDAFSKAIKTMRENDVIRKIFADYNLKKVVEFDNKTTDKIMEEVYLEALTPNKAVLFTEVV